jgi:hypothetical protein
MLATATCFAGLLRGQTCGDLTVTKTETGNVIPWPWDIPTAQIERCDLFNLELAGFTVPLDDPDSNNSLSGGISWNLSGAANTVANVITSGWKVPLNWANVSCTQRKVERIAYMGGYVSQYAFHVGGGGPRGRDTVGHVCGSYSLVVSALSPTTLEVPIHISGSVAAAESFGNPGTTYGQATLSLDGSVNGVGFGPQSASVTSTSVIPDQASVDFTVRVPVNAFGPTPVTVQWDAEVEVITRAQGAGFAGLISGAATAIADFPNTVEIGNLTGPGGAPLPPCVTVADASSGAQFAWTNGTAYCTAKTNSLGCVPAIESSGTPSSTAASGFIVRARGIRNNKAGLLAYSTAGSISGPFQGGTLCVAPPVRRCVLVDSGGSAPSLDDCSGVFEIDMNAFAQGHLGGSPVPELRQVGTRVWCQWWGRDPGAPSNTTLSDALEYSICE